MKGDFSRDVFDTTKHYSAVLLEQGGLITDGDWKEQADLVRYRIEREAADVVGPCGGPLDAAAFSLTAGPRPRAMDTDAANRLWIAAEDGYVLSSTDGGASWTPVDTGMLPLNAVRFSGATGWAAGERGAVHRSNDSGATWSRVDAGTLETLRGIALSGTQRVWLVGDGGIVVYSIDGGAHWSKRSTERTQLNAVSFQGNSNGIAVGAGGSVFTTADGGETWNRQASGTGEDLFDVSFASATDAWAVGAKGVILRSNDRGVTWFAQTSNTLERLSSIRHVSATAAVAAGTKDALRRTTDGGATWTAVNSATGKDLRGIALAGDLLRYVTDDSTVYEVNLSTSAKTTKALPALGLTIGAGRYYVHGTMCEVETAVSYYNQPDRGRTPRLTPGVHLAYAQVWQRHVSALEAPSIREVALGEADPSSRAKTVWQVKTLPLTVSPRPWNCLSNIPEWDQLTKPLLSRMSARAEPQTQPVNVCDVGASAGYRRLENQFYRIEVQQGGVTPSAKWSRENGSVAFAIESVSTLSGSPAQTVIRLKSRGKDRNLDLAVGDWLELLDDDLALEDRVGLLRQFDHDGNDSLEIVVSGTLPSGFAVDASRHPLLRRWDHESAAGGTIVLTPGNWIDLEDGVQVRFEDGTFRPGDYWQIPARTISGDIEWPRNSSGNPLAQLPKGIEDRFCRLALIEVTPPGVIKILSDCRNLFPPLTKLEQLLYVGGDGQDGLPGFALPQPLTVRVTRGNVPVANAVVRFKVEAGNGSLQRPPAPAGQTLNVATGTDGVAQCTWKLDADLAPAKRNQSVSARLLDASGGPLGSEAVLFGATASFSLDLIGGDGQEGAAGAPLDQLLEVRVANGQSPFAGVPIKFNVVAGGGQILAPNPALTSAQGIASARWQLGANGPQRVEAVLADGANNEVQHVAFNAQIRLPATSGSGGCAFTIGKGGMAEKLTSDLMKKLLAEGNYRVCLCFLPGEHEVDALSAAGNGEARLAIHGCGGASNVRLKGSWDIQAFTTFEVSNISLLFEANQGIRILKCRDINFSNVFGSAPNAMSPKTPPLRIGSSRRVTLSHCTFDAFAEAGAPLTIVFEETEAAIDISHCEVAGIVSFYDAPADNKLPLPDIPANFAERLINDTTGKALLGNGGRLRLNSNRIDYLAIGAGMRKKVEDYGSNTTPSVGRLFDEAIVTGNSFALSGGTFIALFIAMSDCTFNGVSTEVIANFAAMRATIVGNSSPIVDDYFALRFFTPKNRAVGKYNLVRILPTPIP